MSVSRAYYQQIVDNYKKGDLSFEVVVRNGVTKNKSQNWRTTIDFDYYQMLFDHNVLNAANLTRLIEVLKHFEVEDGSSAFSAFLSPLEDLSLLFARDVLQNSELFQILKSIEFDYELRQFACNESLVKRSLREFLIDSMILSTFDDIVRQSTLFSSSSAFLNFLSTLKKFEKPVYEAYSPYNQYVFLASTAKCERDLSNALSLLQSDERARSRFQEVFDNELQESFPSYNDLMLYLARESKSCQLNI